MGKILTWMHVCEFVSSGEVKSNYIEINGIQKHQLKTAIAEQVLCIWSLKSSFCTTQSYLFRDESLKLAHWSVNH